jgi:alpha-ketoglutarate-dependent taurine dioxygenase
MTMLVWEFKFEETPPELSAFDAHDVNTHRARNTYIRLVAAEK